MGKLALLIIDPQNDFCEGGALAVPNASKIFPTINKLKNKKNYDHIIITQDYHPPDHCSFVSNNTANKFDTIKISTPDGILFDQIIWPDHCIQNTDGANFNNKLIVKSSDIIIKKGTNKWTDSYSGFGDNTEDKKYEDTGLHQTLQTLGISDLHICGLAYDYCVSYTAKDAIRYGYNVTVFKDACMGINNEKINSETIEMKKLGIKIVNSNMLTISDYLIDALKKMLFYIIIGMLCVIGIIGYFIFNIFMFAHKHDKIIMQTIKTLCIIIISIIVLYCVYFTKFK